MAEGIKIDLVGAERVKQELTDRAAAVDKAIERATNDSTLALQSRIKSSFNLPGFPRRDTGGLERAIDRVLAVREEGGWRGQVGVLAIVPYGRILELGGTVPARDINPVRKRALRWFGGVTHLANVVALAFGITRKQSIMGRVYEQGDVHFARRRKDGRPAVHQEARQQRPIPFLRPNLEAEVPAIEARFHDYVAAALGSG